MFGWTGGSGSIALRRTPDKGSDGLACSWCGHWPDKGFAENWRTSWASYTQSRRSFTRIILRWLKAEAITSTFVGTSSVMSRLSVSGKLDSCDTRAKSKTSLILPKIWITHSRQFIRMGHQSVAGWRVQKGKELNDFLRNLWIQENSLKSQVRLPGLRERDTSVTIVTMTRVTKQLHGTRLLQLVRKSEDQVAHLSARTGVGREADTTKR